MTSRVPNPKKVREALEFIAETLTPAQRNAIRTVIEYEQDTLFLGLEPEMSDMPSDIAHAKREHKRGIHTGLEITLNDITNIDLIQHKVAEIVELLQLNEGSPETDAG